MSIPAPIGKMDFDQAPFLVLWELTRACELACRHCRAEAIRQRSNEELSFLECLRVMDAIAKFGNPLIVFTGGDPSQREDLFDLVTAAKHRGLRVAVTPSATPRTNREVIAKLKESGIERLAISIDGPNSEIHDDFRRVEGSFDSSLSIVEWAHEFKLPVQINTTICKHNFNSFDEMAVLVDKLKAVLWSGFFLVPTGRASQEMQISPSEAESILQRMAGLSETAGFDVKATAAPQFRRVLLRKFPSNGKGDGKQVKIGNLDATLKLGALRSYQSVNDGKGLLFISHTGDILPSGFLPIAAGNVRQDCLVSTYRNHELFTSLRNPNLLKGKCGYCRFKQVCGGSRARAYGETGDYLASDSLCIYDEKVDGRSGVSD